MRSICFNLNLKGVDRLIVSGTHPSILLQMEFERTGNFIDEAQCFFFRRGHVRSRVLKVTSAINERIVENSLLGTKSAGVRLGNSKPGPGSLVRREYI